MNDQACTTADCQCLPAERESARTLKVQPRWNARQTDDGAVVEIALPGVAREELNLDTGNRLLRLDARRRPGPENTRLIRGEDAPDGYELELRLDDKLDGAQATAKLEDGILAVFLPLANTAKPKRIEVA